MKIYLDNCCFNRPFDNQLQLRILLETEAKLKIQDLVRAGELVMLWSYLLEYENAKNPFRERREQIIKWRNHAKQDIQQDEQIIQTAKLVAAQGIKKLDALHIACAIRGGADYFLTTDDGVLKKANFIEDISITDPIGFIKERQL